MVKARSEKAAVLSSPAMVSGEASAGPPAISAGAYQDAKILIGYNTSLISQGRIRTSQGSGHTNPEHFYLHDEQ